jgi:hypothetical protein
VTLISYHVVPAPLPQEYRRRAHLAMESMFPTPQFGRRGWTSPVYDQHPARTAAFVLVHLAD